MKKILIGVVLIIAALCIAYFFISDIAIKTFIEREGSKSLRAELDINSATFHLLPTSLTLRGVQVTNPQQPSSNLLQAEIITLPLQLGELLDRKLSVEQLDVHGLRFAQPRVRSGAIAGLTPPPVSTQAADTLPDSRQLQQQKMQQQRVDLVRTQQDLAALRDDWQQRLRALPGSEQLNDLQFRAQSRDANNCARLRADLNEELAKVRKLQEQFALDFARVQPALNILMPNIGGAVQLATGAPPSIAGALLSQEFKPLLDHILGFIVAGTNAHIAGDNSPETWQILARHVAVDGELNLGSTPLPFIGTIENLTPQPRTLNVVTAFNLQSPAQQAGKFSASGSFDYRKTPLQNARFNITGFPLAQLPLSTQPPLQVTIEEALADIQGLLSVTGNQLDINIIARFQNAKLQVVAQDDPLGRSAAEILRNARDFDLRLQASGDINNPLLKINSSLDALLVSAINRELAATNSGASDPSQRASPEVDALRQLGIELQRMQLTIAATLRALQSLLDN